MSRKNRLFIALLAALLLAFGGLQQSGLAQDSGSDQQEQDPAGQAESGGDSEDDLPDVRRLPPRTDAEERRYKLFMAQQDPFLLDQLNGLTREAPGEFYDPGGSILPVAADDLSRYIVQDKSGAVLGHLEISVRLDPAGRGSGLVVMEVRNELEPPTLITVVAGADDLDVVSSERSLLRFGRPVTAGGQPDTGDPGISPLQNPPRTTVHYIYDRIVVWHSRGGVLSHSRFRELPFSFDRDILPLLVRRVDYQSGGWPLEAAITDTSLLKSLPMALDKPRRETVMSAEPASYYCFESELRIGADISTWWVEQVPPHRLVKFTMEGLTYTLERYVGQ